MIYFSIGINLESKKEDFDMWIIENERAKFWTSLLISLRNHDVQDIFVACTGNLNGFPAAIEAVIPKTEIQNCIIIANTFSYNNLKTFMADSKALYTAARK